jgi:hypothetical protein
MRIPEFTAEVSLSRSRERDYIATAAGPVSEGLEPAFGIDCLPMCLIFNAARCRRMCPPHSIDCLPMCEIIGAGRCRRLCAGLIGF